MKEYEKLAEESAKECVVKNEHGAFSYGFKEGFQKAKEMADDIVENYPQLRRDISKLGEKEV